MADKFGGWHRGAGRRGPPGPAGKDALQLHTWCPKAVLDMFRRDEKCTFYFNTSEDGILMEKNKPEKLRDRFGINNAVCLLNFHKPVKIHNYYALPLEDSLYRVSGIDTATVAPAICIVAVQFRVTSPLKNDKPVCIWTNETGTRGVTISKNSLDILGTDPLKLEYIYEGWNRLIVQYSYIDDDNLAFNKCFFDLNDRRGFFKLKVPLMENAKDIYIGGTSKRKDFASVMLSSFEIYFSMDFDSPTTTDDDSYILPKKIWTLIRDDLHDRTSDNNRLEDEQSSS